MKTSRRKIYWDTTCWLAWLNDERHIWSASVMIGIQDVVYEVETDRAVLFTSAVTRGEIYLGRLSTDKKAMWARLMRRSNVREISADPRVYDRASAIREYHDARKQKIKLPDATHLATAVLYRADEFQTLDGLQQDGSKHRKLLSLSGDVGGYNLKIVHPYPRISPPAELVTVPLGPLFENVPTAKPEESEHNEQTARAAEESHELKADPAHPAPVQGSDSARAQGEAASKGTPPAETSDKKQTPQ
jgi:predicted nucleic acid-binding protein